MQTLRELVSNSKNRYFEDDFDLDLAYITPRTIAMAYPADGLESIFRNHINDVVTFLTKYHDGRYLIINASNRYYDNEKFDGRVVQMEWPNHYPCPFYHFTKVVISTLNYMLENDNNVIAVHCLAGKGRTGSFINAILFTSGQFETIEDANHFYRLLRAVHVTYPSQIRYLNYFVNFLKNGTSQMSFNNKRISKVELRSADKKFLENSEFVVKILDFEKNILLSVVKLSSGVTNIVPIDNPTSLFAKSENVEKWSNDSSKDILIKMTQPGYFSTTKNFRLNFSMLFSTSDFTVFKTKDIDKAKGLPADFEFVVYFQNLEGNQDSCLNAEKFEFLAKEFMETKLKIENSNFRKSLFEMKK